MGNQVQPLGRQGVNCDLSAYAESRSTLDRPEFAINNLLLPWPPAASPVGVRADLVQNIGTGTSSGHGSALRIVRWWHSQHNTSSDRTPLARMLPRVIGVGRSRRKLPRQRTCFSSLFDPKLAPKSEAFVGCPALVLPLCLSPSQQLRRPSFNCGFVPTILLD
jgi:hypothetical protein